MSNGHASALDAILQEWHQVVIGVVYDSPRPHNVDPRFIAYLDRVDRESYGPLRNPFQPEEIKRMWEAYIAHQRLESRVTCQLVKRLEFEIELNVVFPASAIDFVWPGLTNSDAEVDIWRHKLYPDVLNRPIFYVSPTLKLHNSHIRNLVCAGADWKEFIPDGAYEIFRDIDGPKRMRAVIEARKSA